MKKWVLLAVLLVILISCQNAEKAAKESSQTQPITESPSSISKTLEIDLSTSIELEKEHTYSIAVADFNNDGFDDIAAGVFNGQSKIFINNKDNTFTKTALSTSKHNTEAIAVIDFDNDEDFDVMIGNNNQPIILFENDGAGNFAVKRELERTIVKDIAVADFDSDGFDDFAIATDFKENYVYFNNKDGSFEKVLFSKGYPATSIQTGDFNEDGKKDILIGVNRRSSEIYLNEGGRSFVLHAQLGKTQNTNAVAVLDYNLDGKEDAVLGNNKEENQIYLNSDFAGEPAFGTANTYSLLSADLDNDNVKELVVGDYEKNLKIYKKTNGDYALVKEVFAGYVHDLASGDFNNDGQLDIAVARDNENSIIYLS